MLRLILRNCADYMKHAGTPIVQDSIELQKLTLSYPGLVGVIEVTFPNQSEN